MKKNDAVNNPAHYGGLGNLYEAIKVIEAWGLCFCLGNTVKYISRAGKKDPKKLIEDLEKAAWYLQRKIAQLKGHGTRTAKASRLTFASRPTSRKRSSPKRKLKAPRRRR